MGTRRVRFAAAAAAAAIVVAPMALDSAAASTTPPGGSAPQLSLDRPARVTAIGFANEILVVWGVNAGVFERHGLDVELIASGGGSAALAAVLGGAVDFGFASGIEMIPPYAEGYPFQVVAAAYENAFPVDPERSRGVVVGADTGIETACDLVGRTVATNSLGGVGQIYISAWVRQEGCDPAEVNFVALPAAQLASAVETGRIDAANLTSVAGQDLVRHGVGVWIGEPMSATSERTEYGLYISSTEFIEEHPDVVDAFRAGLADSLAEIDDPANAEAWMEMAAEWGRTTVELLETTQMERFDPVVEVELLERAMEILIGEGLLDEPTDLTGMVYQGG